MNMSSAVHAHPENDIRIAMAGLVGAAAVWPLLPVHPPFRCPLRSVTGIPCPFCGMTRACVAVMHGHLGTSLSFNPGGIFVIAIAIVLVFRPRLISLLRGRAWFWIATLGALWIWNIGFNPTFHQLLLR
jgi:hypothetical protein